jgi:hypothetical protein
MLSMRQSFAFLKALPQLPCVQWVIIPGHLRCDGFGRMILRYVRSSSPARDSGHSHSSGHHVGAAYLVTDLSVDGVRLGLFG